MAGRRNVSSTPLSIKYHTQEAASLLTMPSGGCNYTDLALGANAAKCGCRKYYNKTIGGGSGTDGFCMCEHHACYHDHTTQPSASMSRRITQPTSRERNQSPVGTLSAILDIENSPNVSNNLDPMQWSRYMNESSQGLPPIPTECLLPSENGSVTSGHNSAYYRPFGGQGLDTLSHIRRPGEVAAIAPSHMQIYVDRFGVQHLQSLTEVGSPSVRASQEVDLDTKNHAMSVAVDLQTITGANHQILLPSRPGSQQSQGQVSQPKSGSTSKINKDNQQLVHHEQQLREPNDILARMTQHEDRMDQLENLSFTHPAIDQLQEAHEHMEDRIGNLEHRVSDMETTLLANESGSVTTRQSVEGSFDTGASRDSSAIPHIELSRVETMEAQIAELQAIAPPTYSRPWEIEVVMLPFGRSLSGIWSSSGSHSQKSGAGSSGPESSQAQHSLAVAQARLTAYDHNPAWEYCASSAENETAWLMARACGVGSKVDKRLRSRGLVRKIEVCGPDARDVQSAMLKAFGELPDVLAEDPYSCQDDYLTQVPEPMHHYIGLQSPWVPLRKLHKDSCLRFLTPSEMVSPALWTVNFLSSSVAMRHSSIRRLYVTQRDSYIQHDGGLTNWTWQKLQQLPRVYEGSIVVHTPDADVQEECWAFDPRLDPPSTPLSPAHSAFQAQISQLSIESLPNTPTNYNADEFEAEPISPSDHFSSGPASPVVSTPSTPRTSTGTALPPSLAKQRNSFRPAPRRATSMSSAIPLKEQASSQPQSFSSKRRVPSYNRDTHSSTTPPTGSQNNETTSTSQPLRSLEITTKRRRISRSPSRPRNTPRWSNGSPSPYPVFEGERERGTTPFAYATPHSNGPRSAGDIEVYEDEDDDEDYLVGRGLDEDRESTTDSSDVEEGCDQNALSDFEFSQNEQGDIDIGTDGWDGTVDDNESFDDTRHFGGEGPSTYNDHQQDRQIEDDAASDTSETPSEYPSTQQGMADQHTPSTELVAKPALKAVSPTGLYERRQKWRSDFTIHVDDDEE